MRTIFSIFICLALAIPGWAQSQAANGAIEGTVFDTSGGVLPGVTVTITSIDTGAQRIVITNEKGLYRAPLLPLGTYRVLAELPGFKKFEQTDIHLSVGQTAVVNATLSIGAVSETITVSSADSPALDLARIDIGHTMSDQEVHNLPLVARNPYNFALVQPGVTGFENVEFGVPRLAANGAAMRINYQIDGNTNTEKDRAGLRLLPMSEVMIQEVKVVTTGFAPEFGQTMGMVYNAVTPSGTNTFKGEGSYLFRRKPFSAFPFFFGCTGVAASCGPPAADAQKPETRVDTGTADVGGPIVRNKVFFYGGWEQTRRDLSSTSLINQSVRDIAPTLGLKAQPAAVPNVQTAKFAIGKADVQVDANNRLTARWIRFHNDAPYNSGGGTQTLERATDFLDAMDSTAGQLVSSESGASVFFRGSVVSYSDEIKTGVLGVKPETLADFGAVSEPCAREMAEGAKKLCGSTLAVSITGIAGPEGGAPDKPVGTVCFAVCGPGTTRTSTKLFAGDRDRVRIAAAYFALDLARRYFDTRKR